MDAIISIGGTISPGSNFSTFGLVFAGESSISFRADQGGTYTANATWRVVEENPGQTRVSANISTNNPVVGNINGAIVEWFRQLDQRFKRL